MNRSEREAVVDWFAEQMKTKLREPRNEAKGSWRTESLYDLISLLKTEYNELRAELQSTNVELDYDAIIEEAADVANFSMFIADVARSLKG